MNNTIISYAATSAKNNPNQDAYICDPGSGLFAVFDGVGGSNEGAAASNAIKEIFEKHNDERQKFGENYLQQTKAWFTEKLERAHIFIKQNFDGSTTASILVVCPRYPGSSRLEAIFTNVGDSRIYAINKSSQQLILLTRDDTSFRDVRLDNIENRDEITQSMEVSFKFRNMISKAVGDAGTPNLEIIETEVLSYALDNFDGLLLTTDGVHDNLSHREILNILMDPIASNNHTIANKIVEAAKNRAKDLGHVRHKEDDTTAVYIKLR